MHDLTAHYSQLFQAALAEWPTQPAWFKTVREQHLQKFLAFVDGSPQTPTGSCRCSFPNARKKRAASEDPCFRVTPAASATHNDNLNLQHNIIPTSGTCIVFVNGYYCANLSKLTNAIQVTDYQTATSSEEKATEVYSSILKDCERHSPNQTTDNNIPKQDAFGQGGKEKATGVYSSILEDYERRSQHSPNASWSLNIALANSGAYIDVPANTVLTTPIELLFITTDQANNKLCTTHNIINIGANSHIQLNERHINLTANASCSNTLTHINVAANTHLQYYKLQDMNPDGIAVANTYIQQHQHSVANTYYVSKNTKQSCDNIVVTLAEENAHYTAAGLYQPKTQQTIGYHLLIEHKAPKCTSNVLFKGIIDNEAVGTFSGRVVVEPSATDSETHLNNHNLLLSPTARANTTPELKIYTDNIICTHGATVGQLDEQALFYLRSRGIDATTAKDMLIKAFAAEILDLFQNSTYSGNLCVGSVLTKSA